MRGHLATKDYQRFQVGDTLVFEGAELAGKALPGDLVEADSSGVSSVLERVPHRQLVGTLELTSKTRFGITSRGIPIYRFTPLNESYPPFYVSSSYKGATVPVLALVDFLEWSDTTCPRGSCTQILGPCGDAKAEEDALAWLAAPHRWKKRDFLELQAIPSSAPRLEGPTFHVDPEGCRDVDDALTLTEDALYIHITNVARWIEAYPELRGAALLGSTLYKDGRAIVPMFPPHLSEGFFSLLPGVDREVVSLRLDLHTYETTWGLHTIQIQESYTYDSVYASPHAATLRSIASRLAHHDISDSHDWIAQFMILYNCAAAERIRGLPSAVFRRHSAPDQDRLQSLEAVLSREIALRLAQQAGEYCSEGAPLEHYGLQVSAYCHATSPIRRWADCLNQCCMLGLEGGSTPIQHLNEQMKRVRRFERDILYVRAILNSTVQQEIEGTVLSSSDGRVELWIPCWQRVIRTREEGTWATGQAVLVRLFYDPSKRAWKKRIPMVLRPAP